MIDTEFGGGFDFFKNKLDNHLPLNINWEDNKENKSATFIPTATSQVGVHLNFLTFENEKKTTSDNILPINWYKRPHFFLFIIETEGMLFCGLF